MISQEIWPKKKIKRILNIKNGGTPKSSEPSYWEPGEIVWITPEDLSSGHSKINTSKRKISYEGLNNSSANLVKRGSIVLSTRAPIGNIKIVTSPFATNQGCKSLERNNDIDIRYFYYYLSINKEYLNQLGRGTTFLELSNESLKNIELKLPSLPEQVSISNYLDKKTSEIDALIADKEKLISLLEEKRQAVITETVTKGFDPNVKMKDSGIEWIGEIPEYWEVIRLKFLVNNKTHKKKKELELPYVGLENIESNNETILSKISSNEVESESLLFDEGDVLFGKLRPYLKKATRVDFHGCCSSEFLVLASDNSLILSSLLSKLLLSNDFIEYVNSSTYGAKMPRASWEFMSNVYVPLIPIREQKVIIEKLNSFSNGIFNSIKALKKSIHQLKEYRESLIYEAVTGKIDLRDYKQETDSLVAERGVTYGN
ncbi:hypothetical protein GCM10009001_26320 [Virgibacillus siamensis]|uniref:Type I restriction modification DNA specificity domain-containing protein n=1 Tax=Virgibacillus siamensis TaxID=480071 RepID=A0ABP3RHQ3_9BACI